jgi:HrpA-like RNA helicase
METPKSSRHCESIENNCLSPKVRSFHLNVDLKTYSPFLSLRLGRESLIRSIALNNVTIVLGETGSGKTTRMFRRCFLVIFSI